MEAPDGKMRETRCSRYRTELWYFSVIDIVEVLTESSNPKDYWFKMKQRVKTAAGFELSTICRQLKLN